MSEFDNIIKVNIEDQMKTAYIDYSMSVIVSRALPDIRDGLKPVHRRVLYGMYDLGILANRPYKKSARIVGEVLGKYHPHGDTSVYDAMVRMAQEWSLRYPLIDGQGNFGSIDGDSPAAMRYTEARFKKIAEEMLVDIDKNTVDWMLNFDDTLEEPTVLPAKIPQLLVNGASGIAVGMATNMPPHNLKEVVDGIIAYIDNNDITIPELMKFIKAPDFPTGGTIYGYEGVRDAYETGRGRIVMRGDFTIEEENGRENLIVTSIPYQVNKAELIKKTAELVNDKKIDGISEIRDESDRNGIRIVYELKKGTISNVVINKLYQQTALQSSFSVNNIALVNGRPMLLNLKGIISHFVEHRHEVVTRRTQYDLDQAEKRAHIILGLLIALDNIDEVIAIIRAAKTVDDARAGLMERFELSDVQARAIVDMRLRALVGLERENLRKEYEDLLKLIENLKNILADVKLRMEIIKTELLEIKEKYGDEPKTEITYAAEDFKIEDTIADEQVVITISHMGYIKRTPLIEYKRQNRGGRGSKGSDIRDEDFLEYLFVASMHNYMLFFTEQGKCFWLRVFEIPEGTKISKGRAIQNLISIPPEDKVRAFLNVKDLTDKEYVKNNYIILCTKKGVIKKTTLEAYSRPRQNGINAITVRDGDELLQAKLTDGKNEVLMALRSGRAIRFNEAKVRPMGRNAAGVRGITLGGKKDEVIGMICLENETYDILVVSENGYGKRSKLDDYRVTNRGGKGVKTINITDKTGNLISILNVLDNNDLMIINKSGITIRMAVANLRVMGRATQGVRLIDLREDSIAAVAKVDVEIDEDELIDEINPESSEKTLAKNETYNIGDDDISKELLDKLKDEDIEDENGKEKEPEEPEI
ncbi:MAG TPA: DNA gyrase subunit A [Bacteroidales bacterium]|nr:DNA gyrase subunit A [Bacteroidales bacterium]